MGRRRAGWRRVGVLPAALLALLLAGALLAGCGDDGATSSATDATRAPADGSGDTPTDDSPAPDDSADTPDDSTDPPGDSGDPTPSTPEANYAWIQANVFNARCIGCHGGTQSLFLDSSNAPSIVGRASTEQPSLTLIAAGNADASYLILKVEGAADITGARMPFGGPFLSAETLQAMRDWVNAGAVIP